MGDLRFSDVAVSAGLVTQGIGSTSTGGLDHSNSRFYLCKGTQPDQTAFDAAGSSFRSTDWLVTYVPISGVTTTSGRIITLDFITENASQAGTATWFYWTYAQSGASTTTGARLCGSVGLNGSGADLTMADTDIANGELTGIGQINLEIPQSYTY